MAKDFAKGFYTSKAWRECRLSYIAKRVNIDGGMCERCHKQPGYIVHHKEELNARNIKDKYITVNHSNLQFVCKACHDEIHDAEFHGHPEARCMFNEAGEPIEK